MEQTSLRKSNVNILGIISLCISLLIYLLILNWFFQITPYQKLEGMPLMISPLIGLAGLCLGVMSYKKHHDCIAKISLVMNTILIPLPFLYWYFVTLFWGP